MSLNVIILFLFAIFNIYMVNKYAPSGSEVMVAVHYLVASLFLLELLK